jgi:hypothetical protein
MKQSLSYETESRSSDQENIHFYGIQNYVTVLPISHHLTPFQASQMQYTPYFGAF